MYNLRRTIIKASKIIAAEGFFVFFRKIVRRLYWEFGSKYLHLAHSRDMKYREHINQITGRLLIKKILPTNVMDKDPKALDDLLKSLKEEIIETRQEKKP